mmetsp:Transcript_57180/g.140278  ORF Transcript_57180/g.140278 Transcript_57180/m.140278 type:complete len:273 (+) Transcript_57180:493-1311(+)
MLWLSRLRPWGSRTPRKAPSSRPPHRGRSRARRPGAWGNRRPSRQLPRPRCLMLWRSRPPPWASRTAFRGRVRAGKSSRRLPCLLPRMLWLSRPRRSDSPTAFRGRSGSRLPRRRLRHLVRMRRPSPIGCRAAVRRPSRVRARRPSNPRPRHRLPILWRSRLRPWGSLRALWERHPQPSKLSPRLVMRSRPRPWGSLRALRDSRRLRAGKPSSLRLVRVHRPPRLRGHPRGRQRPSSLPLHQSLSLPTSTPPRQGLLLLRDTRWRWRGRRVM